MRKNKLVTGTLKKVLAVASVLMLTVNSNVGARGETEAPKGAASQNLDITENNEEKPAEEEKKDDETAGEEEGQTSDETVEEGKPSDETADEEESQPSDETADEEESKPSDETADEEESKPSDETADEDESKPSDETADEEESKPSDETAADEEESKPADETAAVEESKPALDAEGAIVPEVVPETVPEVVPETMVAPPELLAIQNQLMLLVEEKSSDWYLDTESYVKEEDGNYYIANADGSKTQITDKYLQVSVEGSDKKQVIYIKEDGTQAGQGWHKSNEGWRYLDINGYVMCDGEDTVEGKTVYFDENGIMASDKFVNVNGTNYYYGKEGEKVTDKSNVVIDDVYYNFDADGVSTVVPSGFLTLTDETGEYKIYIGEDGKQVKDKFVDIVDGDKTYTTYIDKNGAQAFKQWATDGEHWLYIDDAGKVVKNKQNTIKGGSYGNFDANGYWTAIEYSFCEKKLSDGTKVTVYAGKEGKVNQKYYFETEDGKTVCYLIGEDGNKTTTVETNDWVSGDLYVDESGAVIKNADSVLIDDYYYVFDAEGHSSLLTDGFVEKEDGSFVYVDEDGETLKSTFKEIGEVTYYFDTDGTMLSNQECVEIDKKYYDFDEDGKSTLVVSQVIILEDEHQIYVDDKGETVKNYFATVDDVTYYFDENGYKVTDEENKKIGDYFYDIDENGAAAVVKNTFITLDGGSIIYVNEEGNTVTDTFVTEDEKIYFFDADGVMVKDSLEEIEDNLYYFAPDGVMLVTADNKQIGGYYYKFDADGHGTKKTNTMVINADSKKLYVDEDGLAVTSEIVEYEGKSYYFGTDGIMVVGLSEIKISDYYYNIASDGVLDKIVNAIVNSDSGKIFVDADGVMKTNYLNTIDGHIYFFGADGLMVTDVNQQLVEGYYYSFNADGYGTKLVNMLLANEAGKTIYLDQNGNQVKGNIITANGNQYYFDAEGFMVSDKLVSVADKAYYFGTDGVMLTGVDHKKIGDFYYAINAGGEASVIKEALIALENGTKIYVNAVGNTVTSDIVTIENKNYYFDANGCMAYNLFLESDGHTIYFGNDGAQTYKNWVQDDFGWRYLNSDGYVVKGKTQRTGASYGTFDASGYWTAIENVFFESKLGDGTVVTMFAGAGGNVVRTEDKQMYCFVRNADGTLHCYLSDNTWTALSETSVTNTWFKDYRLDEAGNLIQDAQNVIVDGRYYNFSEAGIADLVTNQIITITDETGTYTVYIGDDGRIEAGAPVTDPAWYIRDGEYIKVDGAYYTLGQDGKATQIVNQYIFVEYQENGQNKTGIIYLNSDGEKFVPKPSSSNPADKPWQNTADGWRYFNSNGYLMVNREKVINSKTYYFSAEGIMIANQFVILDGNKFYYGEQGEKVFSASNIVIDGHYYNFDAAGKSSLVSNQLIAVTDGENSYKVYVDADGSAIKNTVKGIDGIYYSFDAEGYGSLVTYDIVYVVDGGNNNALNPGTFTGENASVSLSTPSRTGYTFGGWYTDAAFTNRVTTLVSKDNNSSVTLYAKWTVIPSGDSGGSGSDSGSGSSSGSSGSVSAGNAAQNTTGQTTPATEQPASNASNAANAANVAEVSSAVSGQNVTVSTGQSSVAATVAQTTVGSINGNTIVTATTPTTVAIAEGVQASVATVAVAADGSARSLLAAEQLGVTVVQETITVQGTTITQNAVVYADGTKVTQKSGATEMEGFAESVVAAETAIQSGKSIAEVYNEKVSIDLQSYAQVGTAVTYAVTAGTNGTAAHTQMEQTSFAAGQEIVALVTDVNGNVTATTVVVGAGGIIQYEIPGVNCIVRFLQPTV